MPSTHETPRNTSSMLKTTTWGALIALSAAILMAGLVGYSPWTHSGDLGRPTAQLSEPPVPPAVPSTAPAPGDSPLGETVGQALPSHRKSRSSVNAGMSISASAVTTGENLNQLS